MSNLSVWTKQPLDLNYIFTKPAPEQDFVLPNLLAGTVGIFYASGGTGKSFFALEAACCIASYKANLALLKLDIKERGKVVYISLEDGEDELHRRLRKIAEALKSEDEPIIGFDGVSKDNNDYSNSENAKAEIIKNLVIYPLRGSHLDITNEHLKRKGDVNDFEGLLSVCKGARLVILDTLSRMHRLDENSNSDMPRFISTIDMLSEKLGNKTAILMLHHQNKASKKDGDNEQGASRGASSLIDNARFGASLSILEKDKKFGNYSIPEKLRKNYVRFSVSKVNYGEISPDLWFKRNKDGVLIRVDIEAEAASVNLKPNPNDKAVNDEIENGTNVSSINTAKNSNSKIKKGSYYASRQTE